MRSVAALRSLAAIVLPLTAFGLQRALWPLVHHYTCLLFYPAVFASAWIGGVYAGLGATALSAVLAWSFFAPPEGSTDPANVISLGVFVAMGIAFTWFHHRLRTADRIAAAASAELHRMREEWTSIVTHDLQQPVQAIMLRADLLARDGDDVQRRNRDIDVIRASAVRLRRMVDDLTDASLLESRRMRLDPQRLELRGLVERAVDAIPGAPSRVALRAPASPTFVRADAGRVEQIVGNLVSNALKYGSPIAPISVAIDRVGAMASVSVSNQGAPIAPAELPRLFERYGRTHAARASSTSGTGLGLYIVKGLIEAHGGAISVESSPSATTFRFTLPVDVVASTRVDAPLLAPLRPANTDRIV